MRGFFCLLLALSGIASAQDTNFPAGPQYLITSGSPQFLQSIATPSLTLGAQPANPPAFASETISEAESASTPPAAQGQADLLTIYYGQPEAQQPEVSENVIEVSSQEPPRALPAGFVDDGVAAMIDASSLREGGFGLSVGESAAFWKAHKAPAARVYTNRDIERLHGG